MTHKRHNELWQEDSTFTAHELAQGWHWCREYDGLHVSPTTSEWGDDQAKCICGHVKPMSLIEIIKASEEAKKELRETLMLLLSTVKVNIEREHLKSTDPQAFNDFIAIITKRVNNIPDITLTQTYY